MRIWVKKLVNGLSNTSRVLEDASLIELIYRTEQPRTLLVHFKAGRWALRDYVDLDPRTRFVPFSPQNNLIKNEVVLLPSEPQLYGTEQAAISDVQTSIR
jgi:hypothetical protein